jgi:transposase
MSAGVGELGYSAAVEPPDMPVRLRRRTAMKKLGEAFIGIDAAKARNAVAVADEGRDGEIRYLGEFDASPEAMRRLVQRLAAKYERLHFCYG